MRYWVLIGLWLVLVGCGKSTQPAADTVRTDIEGLATLINLPAQPTKVVWVSKPLGVANSRAPGPTDLELHAVVTFAPADLEAIRQQAVPQGGVVEWREAYFKPWYPASVRESFEQDGTTFRLTVPTYDAQSLIGQNTVWKGTFFITSSGDVLVMLGSY